MTRRHVARVHVARVHARDVRVRLRGTGQVEEEFGSVGIRDSRDDDDAFHAAHAQSIAHVRAHVSPHASVEFDDERRRS